MRTRSPSASVTSTPSCSSVRRRDSASGRHTAYASPTGLHIVPVARLRVHSGQALPTLHLSPTSLHLRVRHGLRTPPRSMRQLTPPVANAWPIPPAPIRPSLRLEAPWDTIDPPTGDIRRTCFSLRRVDLAGHETACRRRRVDSVLRLHRTVACGRRPQLRLPRLHRVFPAKSARTLQINRHARP